MFNVGRVCIKLAGRDAGKKCVVVDAGDGKYVTIDGYTRRKKCNTMHLEPLDQVIDIASGAAHETVMKALGAAPRKKSSKAKTEKPKAVRKAKAKTSEAPAKAKKPKAAKAVKE